MFYLDSDFEETFSVVDVKYSNGILGGAEYNSQFAPIKKS